MAEGRRRRKRDREREGEWDAFRALASGKSHTRAESEEDVRLLHTLGLNVPAGKVVLQHADEAFFGVVARLGAARQACRAMGGQVECPGVWERYVEQTSTSVRKRRGRRGET